MKNRKEEMLLYKPRKRLRVIRVKASSTVPSGLKRNPRSKPTLQQLNPLWFTEVSTLEQGLSTDGLFFHVKDEIDGNENWVP